MNSDNYKKAFSNIRPSDERLERIFDMTEKKKKVRGLKKGLIAVMAVIIALMCGALTANAATDGALFDGVKLIMNGEEVKISDYLKEHRSYTADDGTVVDEYKFDLPEGAGSLSIEDIDNSAELEFAGEVENGEGELELSIEKNGEAESDTTSNKAN